jgi:hypothetical protein
MSRVAELAARSDTDQVFDRFQKAARTAQTVSDLAILKFDHGIYVIGGEDVTGRQMIALSDQCGWGWTLFVNGKVLEEHISLIAESDDEPPRPLTYADESTWPKGPNGMPRNPWVFQFHLPLVDAETGAACVFRTSTAGGKAAVGKLLGDFAERRRRQVVVLESHSYANKKFGGTTITPDLKIVSYSSSDDEKIVTKNMGNIAIKKDDAAVVERRNDMDDLIPF